MQQHKCIPNNAGQREASHKRLNSVPFHFYKVRDDVKLNSLGKHT